MNYMRQAVQTKYLPVTNTKPARVKAFAAAGSVTVSWDDGLNVDGNHTRAAKALCEKFEWSGLYFGGGLPEGGFAFVQAVDIDPEANELHCSFRCHGPNK